MMHFVILLTLSFVGAQHQRVFFSGDGSRCCSERDFVAAVDGQGPCYSNGFQAHLPGVAITAGSFIAIAKGDGGGIMTFNDGNCQSFQQFWEFPDGDQCIADCGNLYAITIIGIGYFASVSNCFGCGNPLAPVKNSSKVAHFN
jgi:hypothetical protein